MNESSKQEVHSLSDERQSELFVQYHDLLKQIDELDVKYDKLSKRCVCNSNIAEKLRKERNRMTIKALRIMDDICRANMPMVEKLAHKLRNDHVSHDDLVGHGNYILTQCFHRYNPESEMPFSNYASFDVYKKMAAQLGKQASNKGNKPWCFEILHKFLRVATQLEAETGMPMTIDEVCRVLNFPTGIIYGLAKVQGNPVSLDETRGENEDGSFTLMDTLADESTPDPYESCKLNDLCDSFPNLHNMGLDDRDIATMGLLSSVTKIYKMNIAAIAKQFPKVRNYIKSIENQYLQKDEGMKDLLEDFFERRIQFADKPMPEDLKKLGI